MVVRAPRCWRGTITHGYVVSTWARDTTSVHLSAKIGPPACCVCTTAMRRCISPVRHVSILRGPIVRTACVRLCMWPTKHVLTSRGLHTRAHCHVEWAHCVVLSNQVSARIHAWGPLLACPSVGITCTGHAAHATCHAVQPCEACPCVDWVIWIGLYLALLAKARRIFPLGGSAYKGIRGPMLR